MTIATNVFKAHKAAGNVEKAGKANFADGLTWKERTLWRDKETGELIVILDGEAHRFYITDSDGSTDYIGHI